MPNDEKKNSQKFLKENKSMIHTDSNERSSFGFGLNHRGSTE